MLERELQMEFEEGWPAIEFFEQTQKQSQSWRDSCKIWAAYLISERIFIGSVIITRYPDQLPSIGYEICEQHAGQGIATEAVEMVCTWLAHTFLEHSVSAFTNSDNIASARVLQKNRFEVRKFFEHEGNPMIGWIRHTDFNDLS